MTNFVKRIVPVAVLLMTAAFAHAYDQPALKPPVGAKVAIVEFVDLECPSCAHAAPVVKEAADKYNIPLVRHDFPLPSHRWSRKAAIIARYIDTKSVPTGNDFRDYIFANQRDIDPGNMQQIANKFAAEHHIQLPFQIDPSGVLEKKINDDYSLGQSLGIEATPAIWVVGNGVPPRKLQPDEVKSGIIYQIIETMQQQVATNTPAAKPPGKKGGKK